MNGFETILPFLKPIEHLILDESVSEVMVTLTQCSLRGLDTCSPSAECPWAKERC